MLSSRRIRLRGLRALTVACLSLLVCAGGLQGQQREEEVVRDPARDTIGAEGRERTNPVLSSPLLDAAVSRTEYQLGPGDVITLTILGEVTRQHELRISPEGSIVIPVAGAVDVLGLTIADAERRVRTRLERYYRNIDVDLTLREVRRFKTYLLGQVENAGVREVSATTRVSELVGVATRDGVYRRAVRLRRSGGDSVEVDLARFHHTGDISANPRLREGDVLIVPSTDETVAVYGEVFFPGVYQYRRESLAEFLRVVNSGVDLPVQAADTVRVGRWNQAGERSVEVLSVSEALGAAGEAFTLRPFDAVYVPALEPADPHERVVVEGEVHRPGTYPIVPGVTTIRDIIQQAGGVTPRGAIGGGSLFREAFTASGAYLERLRDIPPELLSQRDRQILQASSFGDNDRVVVDFAKLFADGVDAYDQPLRTGDRLVIPERRNEILVIGAVARPGIVASRPQQRVSDVLALAGGLTRRADRGAVVVIKADSPVRLDAGEVRDLGPGDTVIVPYRERTPWREILQSTSAVVSTITGLYFTLRAIF